MGGRLDLNHFSQLRWANKTWLQIRKRTKLHPIPALTFSGKELKLRVIFLAKIPLGDRLDCLAQPAYRSRHAPHLPDLYSHEGLRAIARNMRAS